MDENRTKEIAIRVIAHSAAKEGMKLTLNTSRSLKATADRIKQPLELLNRFHAIVANSIVDVTCGITKEFDPYGFLPASEFGDLALALLQDKLSRDGMRLSHSSVRDLGEAASKIGVSLEELQAFARPYMSDMVARTFCGQS